MAKVFGFGVGLIVLMLLWIVGILASIVLSRYQGVDFTIGPLILTLLISLILIFFPRENPLETGQSDVRILDDVFIPRVALVTFLCVILFSAFIYTISRHWSKPITAKPVRFRT